MSPSCTAKTTASSVRSRWSPTVAVSASSTQVRSAVTEDAVHLQLVVTEHRERLDEERDVRVAIGEVVAVRAVPHHVGGEERTQRRPSPGRGVPRGSRRPCPSSDGTAGGARGQPATRTGSSFTMASVGACRLDRAGRRPRLRRDGLTLGARRPHAGPPEGERGDHQDPAEDVDDDPRDVGADALRGAEDGDLVVRHGDLPRGRGHAARAHARASMECDGHESSFRTAAGAACVRRRARWPGAVQYAVRKEGGARRRNATRGFVDVVRRVRATTVPARAMRAAAPRAGRAADGDVAPILALGPVAVVSVRANVCARSSPARRSPAGGRAGRRSAEGESCQQCGDDEERDEPADHARSVRGGGARHPHHGTRAAVTADGVTVRPVPAG